MKIFKLLILGLCFGTTCMIVSAQNLNDKKATPETKALYRNLRQMQGKSILFGHQDDTAYGIGWTAESNQSDVKKVTGDYPAVYGWDLGHIELGDSLNIDKVPFDRMRRLMIEAYRRGGVNTVSWHLRNPYTAGSAWDVTSDKVVKSILPGGEKHQLYIKWLDRLAAFFDQLNKESGTPVPILFRPFHEHSGSWFWWGKNLCSVNEYVSLWHFTVDYLRDKKNIHNLVYIYSPDFVKNKQEYFDRYPGDAYIDMLGLDLYHRDAETKSQEYISNVKNIMGFLNYYSVKSGKPYAFSETGLNELPMYNWFTEVLYPALQPNKPIYVLVWRNAYDLPGHYFIPYPGHPAGENLIEFKNLPDVLFENELSELYK